MKTEITTELTTYLEELKKRRHISDASIKKYRRKLSVIHKLVTETNFENIDFLKHNLDKTVEVIQKETKSSARQSYSCLLGCVKNLDGTIIEGYEKAAEIMKAGMELLNQEYQENKKKNPHSDKQLESWVNLTDLYRFQAKKLRRANKIRKEHPPNTQLKWRDFNDIQDSLIITMYLNHRKAKEKYPAWFKMVDINRDLPDESKPSLPAPKRLEWCEVKIVDSSSVNLNCLPKDENILYYGGQRPYQKRLWWAKQKVKKEHYEPVFKMLNQAIENQMWGLNQYFFEEARKTDYLLTSETKKKLSSERLGFYIRKAFSEVSKHMTCNLLRHIVAEETGHDSNLKKQVKEQMVNMNHSESVHNLVYST